MKKNLMPEKDPSSIGNILVDMGFLDEKRLLDLVAKFQASKDELLGEFIMRHTELMTEQIEIALIHQKRLRSKVNEAMIVHMMEISHNSHQQIMDGIEELVLAAKVEVK